MNDIREIKSKLLSGMMVVTRGGDRYLVLRNTGMKETDITGLDLLIGIRGNVVGKYGWMNLQDYDKDLRYSDDCYSIQAIYAPRYASEICDFKKYKEIWNREN